MNHKDTKAQIDINVLVVEWRERYETAQVSYLLAWEGFHVYGITKLYVITPVTLTG